MSVSSPTPIDLATLPEHLPDDVPTLQRMILELATTLQQQRADHDALRHRLGQLLQRLYGPRSERHDPNQPLLFAEPADEPAPSPPAEPTEPTPPPSARKRCRPHGRRRLPDNLPRETRHHQLAEAERICGGCGGLRLDIGTDRSEQLEYRPASLLVIEHVVHKYVCPCCRPEANAGLDRPQEAWIMPPPSEALPTRPPEPVEPEPQTAQTPQPPAVPVEALRPDATVPVVIAAARPAMPIERGLPGPGLLAHLIVSKYSDHLPLYGLERIYERQGVLLSRSTLSDWLAASAVLLQPLYELMVARVLQSRALHTDDTTVKLQDPQTHRLSTARLWGYLGDAGQPYNVFDFTPNRKRDGPQQFLANYQGYLHADAFSGYDGLYLPDPETSQARIVEVACNAHARRKFYEARSSDALRSHQALAYYGQLYELERAAKDFSEAQRLAMRQDLSLVILGQLRGFLEVARAAVLPKSPMGEAIGYALNHWVALCRYTEAGFLSIDNNVAEREMKRIAIGRKNWLTIGSPRGGKTAAVLMSFTSSCARLGVEPWGYVQEVLSRLPGRAAGQLEELLPDRWQAARKASRSAQPGGHSTSAEPCS